MTKAQPRITATTRIPTCHNAIWPTICQLSSTNHNNHIYIYILNDIESNTLEIALTRRPKINCTLYTSIYRYRCSVGAATVLFGHPRALNTRQGGISIWGSCAACICVLKYTHIHSVWVKRALWRTPYNAAVTERARQRRDAAKSCWNHKHTPYINESVVVRPNRLHITRRRAAACITATHIGVNTYASSFV